MNLREQLVALLREKNYRPVDEIALAKQLGLTKKQRGSLNHEVRRLLASGEIQRVQGDRLKLAGSEEEGLTGTIFFKSQGNAVVRTVEGDTTGEGDVFIEAGDTDVALHGDRVSLRITSGSLRRRERGMAAHKGKVLRVLDRAKERLVGTMQKSGKSLVLIPDDPRFPPVRLKDPANTCKGPQPSVDDKIVVRLLPWTDRYEPLSGEVERKLGKQFEPAAELLGVYEKFSLERHFPAEVEREANTLPSRVRSSDLVGREDFRQVPTLTIDPDDAKDFDDALSIETLENGAVRIGVHIADVSSYVRPGTALDREAQRRGNSTYLVGTVVPMLPERLSNGLCSLVEAEDRLTLAVLLTFDKAGHLKNTEFARTVIRSRKRLSYRQALALMFESDFDKIRAMPALPAHQTGATGRPLSSLDDLELVDLQSWLRKLWAIAKKIRTERMAAGCLDLDMPETKIFVDKQGYSERLVKMEHDESHQLIEEYMLAANEAVARLTRSSRLASLYRVHDEPDFKKLNEYREFVATMGIQCGDLNRRTELVRMLGIAERHPQAYLLKSMLLRSMKKACYRATPDGHFGLNKKDYTHFTSPIRRYADLVVHRVLVYWLAKQSGTPNIVPPDRGLSQQLADHLSDTEVNSQEAERESFKIKLLEFFERELTKRPKTPFKAIITEVRQGGLFVELTESMTFGFLPMDALEDDYYVRSPAGNALVGRRTKRRYQVGDTIEVVIHKVDRYRRMIDFAPV